MDMESRRDARNALEHRRAQNRMAQRRFRQRQNQLKATAVNRTDLRPQIALRSPVHAPRSRGSPTTHAKQQQQQQDLPVWTTVTENTDLLTSVSGSSSTDSSTPSGSSTSIKSPKVSYGFGRDCLQGRNNGLLGAQSFVSMNNLNLPALDLKSKFSSLPSLPRSKAVSKEHSSETCGRLGQKTSSLKLASSLENMSDENSSGHRSLPANLEGGVVAIPVPPRIDLTAISPTHAERGQDSVSSSGQLSPLHIAAQKGYDRIVRVLLQHKSDCNECDSNGLTPLIHATIGGFENVVTSLLSHGAHIEKVDNQGKSALHWAVIHKRDALLKILLGHCVEDQRLIDIYDKDGRTPLHRAIDMGFEAGVEILLQFGANVDCMTRNES